MGAFAQSRGQLLQDVRQVSDLVSESTYSSQASIHSLQQARQLLEEAYDLVSGSRSGSDILCARGSFGYVPTNTATGMSYGEDISSLSTCQQMLPPPGAAAMCAKSRFGYQPINLSRGLFIGDNYFAQLDDCLRVAPTIGQTIMCARSSFGFTPYNINTLSPLGDYVTSIPTCMDMLPVRGSQLMCIKVSFGFQAINISTGRSFGQRTATLDQCHLIINRSEE
tara:strand:+ start:642 stop:1310 length:669 start_codon:yes stop_codon:yes gene_type:complete